MFLRSDEPRFTHLVHLLRYYYENNLPTCHARLEVPLPQQEQQQLQQEQQQQQKQEQGHWSF